MEESNSLVPKTMQLALTSIVVSHGGPQRSKCTLSSRHPPTSRARTQVRARPGIDERMKLQWYAKA